MKTTFIAIALAVLLLATPAQAADTVAAKILTVDVQKILKDSSAAAGIRKQLDEKRTAYQNEIKGEETKLRNAEQEIVKSKDKLTKEQLVEKQKKLREDFRAVETKVQQRRKALDQAYAQGMKKVGEALAKVVIDEAKARGANMVIPKSGTMWHAPELEITDTVLAGLNKALPSVKVTIVDK